jgi:type II secretory pathway component PulK
MGLWGTAQININSAPRNVLEAAFTFGGDAQQIADGIIKKRREKPFADIEAIKKELFRFSDSIDKCKPYITTNSNVFSIHVTAVNGVAKVSTIVVLMKNGGKIQKVAVLSG